VSASFAKKTKKLIALSQSKKCLIGLFGGEASPISNAFAPREKSYLNDESESSMMNLNPK
jgi:hypothetical protein